MTQAEYNQRVNTFFNTWIGKGINFDGAYGNQCKDVFSRFNYDVGRLPYITGDAYPLWAKSTVIPKYYDKIWNTITAVPRRGDITIWYPMNGNPYGHISVVSSANMFWFTSMDQNWPVQGYYNAQKIFIGTGKAHYQNHNYLNPKVAGWLRLKI